MEATLLETMLVETMLVETTLIETKLVETTLLEFLDYLTEDNFLKDNPSILVHPVQESANIYPIFVDDILRFGRHHWKH